MNYALYLEDGNKVPQKQFTEQEAEMIKTLQPYGEAFKLSPGAAIEMAANDFNFSIESDDEVREFLAGLDAYAKLIGDTTLVLDILKFGETGFTGQPDSFKCGGRVRAKVKKASCGKKLEKGAKIPVEKKGGCPCQYKKVGGCIQLVDCNGIPVAKHGDVLKFLEPAQPITYTRGWSGDTFTYNPTTRKFSYKSGYSTDASKRYKDYGEMSWEDLSKMEGSQDFAAKLYEAGYTNPADNVYFNRIVRGGSPVYEWGNVNRFNSGNYNGISYNNGVYRNGTTTLTDQQIYDLASKDPKMMDWLVGHNKYGYRGQEIDYNGGKAQWDPAKMKYVYKQLATAQELPPQKSAGLLMFERANLGLSDYSLAGRQKWVKDNADYLKSLNQGWDDARINAYKGSAIDNRALLQAIQGKSAWDAKQADAAELARLKAENANLQRIEVPVMNPTKVTPDAMSASNPNLLTLDRNRNIVNLNTITPAQALNLNNSGWNRYMSMTFGNGSNKLNYANYLK